MRRELRQKYKIREMRKAGLGYKERGKAISRMKAEDARKVRPKFAKKKPQAVRTAASATQSSARLTWFQILTNLIKKLCGYLKRRKK